MTTTHQKRTKKRVSYLVSFDLPAGVTLEDAEDFIYFSIKNQLADINTPANFEKFDAASVKVKLAKVITEYL